MLFSMKELFWNHQQNVNLRICIEIFVETLKQKIGNHTTGDFTRESIEIIESFNPSGNDRLFLTVSFNAPHFPWITNRNMSDFYADRQDIEVTRRKYLNLVTEMDQGIGNIQQKLEEKNMWKNRDVSDK